MLLKGAPACANEVCFLVAPGVSLGRPSKLPLKHPQTGGESLTCKEEEACIVWDSSELNDKPWLLEMGVELWGVIASSQLVLML